MRNYFAIAFIIVYLILTVGVAKSTHYCMGRFNNLMLFSFESKKCPCSLFEDEPSSSCHDESELVKIDDDQQLQTATIAILPAFFLIESFELHQQISNYNPGNSLIDPNLYLPPKTQVPIYKLNCALTFYSEEAQVS